MSTWSTDEEREQYIKWFVKWTGLSEDWVRCAVQRVPTHYYEKEFECFKPLTQEELTWWYRTSGLYCFHLSWHTYWPILDNAQEPILDYGGGLGNNFFPLLRQGKETHYFDISYACTNFVRWRLNEEKMIGSAKYRYKILSPFSENKFDYVRCFHGNYNSIVLQDVIEHISDYAELLSQLIGHLNVGGFLFEETNFGVGEIGEHVHLKEKESLPKLLIANNMKLVQPNWWVKES